MTLAAEVLKDADRVGHPALQRVDGVHQQQTIIGVDVGIGLERIQLRSAERHKGLHHTVRVGALRRVAEDVRDTNVRGKVSTADQRRASPGIGRALVRPAQPKLQKQPSATTLVDARRLGRNERLVVQMVEQGRLQNLSHRKGTLHDGERHIRMHHTALRYRTQRDTLEGPIRAQPLKEIVVEKLPPCAVLLPPEIRQILVPDVRGAHPVQEPVQPGVDAVTGLVRAVVRVAPEEVIKLRTLLVQSHPVVELRHRQLVLIGIKNTVSCRVL